MSKGELSEIKQNFAIVIGIDDYINLPELKTAVADAKELVKVLEQRYKYRVLELCDDKATKTELDKLIKALKKNKNNKENSNSRILFYFAGHGYAVDSQDKNSKDCKPAGYFMPQDAERDNKNTWLSMHEVYEAFSDLNCHHLLMILDCCFAGRISWVGQGRNAVRSRHVYRQSYDRFIKHKTEQIITSAAYDEEAQDISRFGQRGEKNGHSPFAHLLLKVLKGNSDGGQDKYIDAIIEDKIITVHELFVYLQNQLGEIAQGQTPGLSQPQKSAPETGEYVYFKGEYIFPLPQFNPEELEKFKLDRDRNPYKGLASFDDHKDDQKLFFGRQTLSQKLAKEVTEKPLTIVLGVSGSGKSSLVKAGLIPALEAEASSDQQWLILKPPMRAGESPFKELNKILTQSNSGSSIINHTLEEQVKIIKRKIGNLISRNPQSKLLLVIDQTEELLTLCRDKQKREKFLSLLAELSNKYPQLRIVLTLRSDFEPQLKDVIKEPNWQKAWQDGRFFVTSMNREELQQAIEEPAAQRTLFFESPELVNQLIDEVIQMPGALPLLSFTLSQLYLKYLKAEEKQERDDRTITKADYKELGGVASSLTQTADQTYEKLIEEEKIDPSTIRNVMLRMVSIGSGELARRRVLKTELEYPKPINEQVRIIVIRFVEARLLTTGLDVENREYIEPVHDVLITGWTQIRYWLDEKQAIAKQKSGWNPIKNLSNSIKVPLHLTSKENSSKNGSKETDKQLKVNLPLQRDVSTAALKWGENEKETKYLWNASPYLDVLRHELQSEQNNWFNRIETDFVERSVAKKNFNTKRNWGIAIAVTLGSIVLAGSALVGQRYGQIGQIEASRQSSEANLLLNQELDALIESLRAGNFLKQPLLQLVKPDNQKQKQLNETLQKAVYQVKERNRLNGGDLASGVDVSFSPKDSQLLATAGDDGTVRLWDLQGKKLEEWKTDPRLYVSFSPDGQLLATTSVNGMVRLWNLQGDNLKEWNAEQGWLNPVSFSPDGRRLVTTGQNGMVRLWNLQGDNLKEWNAEQGMIWHNSFSPDGQRLATVGWDGTVRLWDLQGRNLKKWNAEQGFLRNVSFSPDGQLLATKGDDGTVGLWNFQGQPLTELKDDYPIGNVSFSPDGQQLATVGENGTIGLWNLQGQPLAQWKGSQGTLTGVSFSPNGQLLATAGSSDTVSLWDLRGQPLTELKDDYPIASVSFSPDAQQLTTVGLDGTIGLWNLQGKQLAKLKSNHKIISVSFSPDGQRFASVGEDGTARLWDLQGKQLAKLKSNDRKIASVNFSLDGQLLASVEEDGTARLWDLATSQPLKKFSGKQRKITSNSFSPDDQLLATIEQYDYVHLWNWQGQPVAKTPIGHRGGVSSFGFSPDTKLLATAGKDGFVRVWQLQGTKLKNFSVWQATQGSIWNLKFSPDGQRLATAGNDGTVRLWDLQGHPLTTWKVEEQGAILSVSFSPNGQRLATTGVSGKVKLLPIKSFDELMKRGCNWARDYLQNNPDVSQSDRHLCDHVPKVVAKDKSF